MDISGIQMMFATLDDKHGLQLHWKMNCRIQMMFTTLVSFHQKGCII